MNGKTPVGLQRSSFTFAGEKKIVYFIAKAECLQPEEVLEVGENSTCKRVLIDHKGNLLLRPLERTNDPQRVYLSNRFRLESFLCRSLPGPWCDQ